MTLLPTQLPEILHLLERCGVSRFNVQFRPQGLVIFHSAGLSLEDVLSAQYLLARYLMERAPKLSP